MTVPTSTAELADLVAPIAERLATIDLTDADAARDAIAAAFPPDGESIKALRTAAEAGMEAGWLLPKENAGIRFGRVAKDLHGFSLDAVWMAGPGPKHRHPNGEIDLCFALNGTPAFDGNAAGWTVYGPGSAHVPTVRDGEMLILYFLPGGAIEWL